MSSKDKNLTPVQQEYKKFAQEREPKRPVLKNCIKAFFVGGFICFIGQLISTFYITYFDFTERSAGNPTVATLIFISMSGRPRSRSTPCPCSRRRSGAPASTRPGSTAWPG